MEYFKFSYSLVLFLINSGYLLLIIARSSVFSCSIGIGMSCGRTPFWLSRFIKLQFLVGSPGCGSAGSSALRSYRVKSMSFSEELDFQFLKRVFIKSNYLRTPPFTSSLPHAPIPAKPPRVVTTSRSCPISHPWRKALTSPTKTTLPSRTGALIRWNAAA